MEHHGMRDMVKRIEGEEEMFLIGEVAKMVGRDKDTIRKWGRNHPELLPSHQLPLGEKGYKVWLWTHEEVVALKEFAKTQKPGRPKGS